MRASLTIGAFGALVAVACAGDEGTIGGGQDAPNPFANVEPVAIYEPVVARSATDLAFNPMREGELWVTVREPYDDSLQCTQTSVTENPAACQQLIGKVAVFEDATVENPEAQLKEDPNGWHFMRRVPSIAFGANDTFGTCGEARTGNWEDEPPDFIGPTLWSSDPAIFAQQLTPEANGSHLDMLHSSPFCVGIAHEVDNVYWLFNGQSGSVDRYDFKAPHEPGGEDHSDGEITRYVAGSLTRVPNVPGHLVIDGQLIYIADTGGQRIVSFDITEGTMGEAFLANDPIAVHNDMDGVSLIEVVPAGMLERPSGIALHPDGLLVTDNATSLIHLFSKDGRLLATLDTELPTGTLAGIEVGPDGKIYFTDLLMSRVFRLE